MSHAAFLAVLMLAACTSGPPSPEETTRQVVEVLDGVLAQPRPYRAAAVGEALGVTFEATAASNTYFEVSAALGPAPFASIEVREPRESARGGLVLLRLNTGCVAAEALADRAGPSTGFRSVPGPEAPADTPRYDTHIRAWGELRLGYAPETGCLRSVVLDAA